MKEWYKIKQFIEFRSSQDEDGKSLYPKIEGTENRYCSSGGEEAATHLIYIRDMYTQFEITSHTKSPMEALESQILVNNSTSEELLQLFSDFLQVEDGYHGVGLINQSCHLRSYTKKILD